MALHSSAFCFAGVALHSRHSVNFRRGNVRAFVSLLLFSFPFLDAVSRVPISFLEIANAGFVFSVAILMLKFMLFVFYI